MSVNCHEGHIMMIKRLRSKTSGLRAIAAGTALLACGSQTDDAAVHVGQAKAALSSGTPLVGVQSSRCLDVAGGAATLGRMI